VPVAAQLDGEQLHAWVEPDDELRALARDRLGEAVRKRDGGDGGLHDRELSARTRRRPPRGGPRRTGTGWSSAALDCGLELAARAELRYAGSCDLHALARARVDALPGRPVAGAELAEPCERHVPAAAQGLGDGVDERVHGLSRVPLVQLGLVGDLVHELLLRHFGSSCRLKTRGDTNKHTGRAQPCGFAAPYPAASICEAVNSGRRRTACRASSSTPPSSRSTTHTAVRQTRPTSRSASTDETRAPPEVTTSS